MVALKTVTTRIFTSNNIIQIPSNLNRAFHLSEIVIREVRNKD